MNKVKFVLISKDHRGNIDILGVYSTDKKAQKAFNDWVNVGKNPEIISTTEDSEF